MSQKYRRIISKIVLLVMLSKILLPLLNSVNFGVPEAYAANWLCGQDLNGDGYVDAEGETAQCIVSQQGQLCPIGAQNCTSSDSCPLGNYPCVSGSCTQAGVCSSVNVPITQYQCPTTGSIYNDSATCNSNCTQWGYCNANYGSTSASGAITGSYVCGGGRFTITGSGNVLYVSSFTTDIYGNPTAGGSISFSGGITVSGSVSVYTCEGSAPSLIASGNQLNIYAGSYRGTIYFSGATLSGAIYYSSQGSGILELHGVGSSLRTSPYPVGQAISISTGPYYSCPLGGYSCAGSPPYCVAPRSCVTYDSSITKYQCSLTGTNYDTQNQCTSSCTKTASCSTNYSCPLGDQYACINNGGAYQCSPNTCIDTDVTQAEIEKVDDAMLQDDGARDAEGNCLGQVYLFTGRGMRCRPSGYSTGFGNCCAKSQGALKDSMGNLGSTFNIAKNTIGGLYTGYKIIDTASKASKIGENSNLIRSVTFKPGTTDTVTKVTFSDGLGREVYSFAGDSAQAVKNVTPGMGADAAAGSAIQNYAATIGPQLALAAVTMAIKDPALSSAVNLVGQVILGAGPVGIALAVVSLGLSVFSERCDQQDIETSTLNDSKMCHYVGDYCEKKWSFIGCVQKAKGYCCFNSKLGRIIHEQGRPQLQAYQPGGAWGSGKTPNCRGFTPEEFQMLDFAKIDLSEYFADIQTKAVETIQQNAADKIQQYYQNIR